MVFSLTYRFSFDSKDMNSLRCHSKIPDIIAGSAVYERGHYKSDRVEHAQKEMLDKLKSRKSQTSGIHNKQSFIT